MSVHIKAVYEHGVLRPLQPLELAEGERVKLELATTAEIEARRRAQAELDAREIEIINRNAEQLKAEAWDVLNYQVIREVEDEV